MLITKRPGAASVVLAALMCAHRLFAQAAPIGFVSDLDGKWLADGQPIQLGQEVLAGSTLSLSPETTVAVGRSIAIALGDNTRIAHTCQAAGVCSFTLPASLNAPSTAWSRLADAFHLIFGRPDRYVAALSRGAPSAVGDLSDGVVRIQDQRMDPAPLLHDVDAGRYVLRFEAIARDAAPQTPAMTVRIDWRAPPLAVVLPPGLGPGLYKVGLFPAAQPDADQLGDDAWALLAAAPRYVRVRADFQQAAAIANAWGRDVPAKERRRFLRATLDHLALAK